MAYQKHYFVPKTRLRAAQLNEMDDQIILNDQEVTTIKYEALRLDPDGPDGKITILEKQDFEEFLEILKTGSKQMAPYHLGFYIDEQGDLCQEEY